jgi:hypothetical protein
VGETPLRRAAQLRGLPVLDDLPDALAGEAASE